MVMLGAHAARAAAVLVASTPTRYAAMIHSPRVLRLRFSEAIVRKSSRVRLTDVTGRQVRVTPVKVHADSRMEVAVDAGLGAGVYTVHWTSVSAVDGSKTAGSFQFTVQ